MDPSLRQIYPRSRGSAPGKSHEGKYHTGTLVLRCDLERRTTPGQLRLSLLGRSYSLLGEQPAALLEAKSEAIRCEVVVDVREEG